MINKIYKAAVITIGILLIFAVIGSMLSTPKHPEIVGKFVSSPSKPEGDEFLEITAAGRVSRHYEPSVNAKALGRDLIHNGNPEAATTGLLMMSNMSTIGEIVGVTQDQGKTLVTVKYIEKKLGDSSIMGMGRDQYQMTYRPVTSGGVVNEIHVGNAVFRRADAVATGTNALPERVPPQPALGAAQAASTLGVTSAPIQARPITKISGNYSLQTPNSSGEMVIESGTYNVSLNVVTDSGCVAEIQLAMGDIKENGMLWATKLNEDGKTQCVLEIKFDQQSAFVSENGCTGFHGVACGFVGTYTKKGQ